MIIASACLLSGCEAAAEQAVLLAVCRCVGLCRGDWGGWFFCGLLPVLLVTLFKVVGRHLAQS